MSCSNPIDAAVLADYWLAALTTAEEESVEEHLLSCDECGARLQQIIALGDGIHDLARRGNLLMVVSDEFLKRVAAEGLRVREYAPPRGGSVQCTVSLEDDFLVGRLTADLTEAKRIDLAICDKAGTEMFRLADIPYNPQAGSVVFQQSIGYAKAASSEVMIARLVGVDGQSEPTREHLIGEYTFIHTRTIPGPGIS
jgi:hypothetical protein